jgi:hypothetical protein
VYRAGGRQPPQFVGQTKLVGQYSLHSRAILAYKKNGGNSVDFVGNCVIYVGNFVISWKIGMMF